MKHNSQNTSLSAYHNPELQNKWSSLSQVLLIAFHTYRDEKFTFRTLVDRVNQMGWKKKITYKQAQPRVSDLLRSNKIHKVGDIKEGQRLVSQFQYGNALFVKRPYKDILIDECYKRMDEDHVIIAQREADRLFEYQKTQV